MTLHVPGTCTVRVRVLSGHFESLGEITAVGASFGVLYATLLTVYATSMQRNQSNPYYDAVAPRVNITNPIHS